MNNHVFTKYHKTIVKEAKRSDNLHTFYLIRSAFEPTISNINTNCFGSR